MIPCRPVDVGIAACLVGDIMMAVADVFGLISETSQGAEVLLFIRIGGAAAKSLAVAIAEATFFDCRF